MQCTLCAADQRTSMCRLISFATVAWPHVPISLHSKNMIFLADKEQEEMGEEGFGWRHLSPQFLQN